MLNAVTIVTILVLAQATKEVLGLQSTCPSRGNLALKRPTKQSSFMSEGFASNAVDGNTGTVYFKDGCSETSRDEPEPWWTVQLDKEYTISYIKITNRGDCCGERLKEFSVFVSDSWNPLTSTNKVLCKYIAGHVAGGATIRIDCDKPTKGSYVSIHMTREEQLTLCEVEVYSEVSSVKCSSSGLVLSQKCLLKCYQLDRDTTVDVLNFMDCAIDCVSSDPCWPSQEKLPQSSALLKSVPCTNKCYSDYLTGTYNNACEESTAAEELMSCFTACVFAAHKQPQLPSPHAILPADRGRIAYMRCYVECLRTLQALHGNNSSYPCTNTNYIRMEQCSHRCSVVYSKVTRSTRDLTSVLNNLDNSACILDCGKLSLKNACEAQDKLQLKNCVIACTLDDHSG